MYFLLWHFARLEEMGKTDADTTAVLRIRNAESKYEVLAGLPSRTYAFMKTSLDQTLARKEKEYETQIDAVVKNEEIIQLSIESRRIFTGQGGYEPISTEWRAPASPAAGYLQLRRKVGADMYGKLERYLALVRQAANWYFATIVSAEQRFIRRAQLLLDTAAYIQLTGINLLRRSRVRRLPIRPRQNIRFSGSRSAFNYCRITQNFAEASKGLESVGLTTKVSESPDGSSNDAWRIKLKEGYGIENPYVLGDVSSNPCYFSVYYKFGELGHAMGGIVLQDVMAFIFNGYTVPQIARAYLAIDQPQYGWKYAQKHRVYPKAEWGIDLQASLESSFGTVGECQELAVVLPYLVMKSGALKPVLTLLPKPDTTDPEPLAAWDEQMSAALITVDANVEALYRSLMPFSLARYNEIRREAQLLGGFSIVGPEGSRLVFSGRGIEGIEVIQV